MAEKRRILLKMNSPREIQRTLSRISNMVINNELDTRRANTIIFACNSVLNSIRTDEQQKQIDILNSELETLKFSL